MPPVISHPVLTVTPVKSVVLIQLLLVESLSHTARFVALASPLLNILMMLATWAQALSVILDHWLPLELAVPLLCNPLNSIVVNAVLLPSGAVA